MALDVGEKTVGVAVSDELGITVSPRTTLKRDGLEINRLQEMVRSEGIGTIVVGLPVSLNGTHGPAVERSEKFVALLRERIQITVETWDERLTTTQAERLLISQNVRREKRRQIIDQAAAALILEDYLRAKSPATSTDLQDWDGWDN